MDKNPLEQQRTEINLLMDEARTKFGDIFDDKENVSNKIHDFILQLEFLERSGLVFNVEEIVKGLKESVEIQDKEEFIAHIIKILEPIILLKVTKPKIFDKAQRESLLSWKDNIRLSEVLYIRLDELNDEHEEIFIHLPPAKDYMTKDKIENFKQEIKKGLVELAKILKDYPNKKEIWASSWIIATPHGPKRLEDLGFTFSGIVSEEERREHFPEEKRPIARAFMKREDFLTRYSSAK